MAFMYSLKTAVISKHCSAKYYQQLLPMKRERVKENHLRGSHCEMNFRLFNLRMAETDQSPVVGELPVSCAASPTPWTTIRWEHYCCTSNMLTESKCSTAPSWNMRKSHTHTKRKIPSDFQSSENSNSLLGLFYDYKSLIIYDSWKQMWFISVSPRQKINP